MSTTLGLDIGTNSIGWALIEDEKRIIDRGIEIFPEGINRDSSGKEESKNTQRRISRHARRRRFRYLLRREKLINILSQNGMMPIFRSELLTEDERKNSTKYLYGLRKKGLEGPLSLEEFGRILFMLNKRRGFKSTKQEKQLFEELQEEEIKSKKKMKRNNKNEFPEDDPRNYLHQVRTTTEQRIASGSKTIGEWFASFFIESENNRHNPWHEPLKQIRRRKVAREEYENEFELLWQEQSKHNPETLNKMWTEKNKDGKIVWKGTLKDAIGLRTIFYQRKLRSQKHLVGHCKHEPKKRTTVKSSFLFQEYRLWEKLHAIRITNRIQTGEKLSLFQMQTLISYLSKTQKLKLNNEVGLKKFVEILDLPPDTEVNDVDSLPGNTTDVYFCKALGSAKYVELKKQWENEEEKITRKERKENQSSLQKLFHALLYTNDENWLKKFAADLGFGEKEAEAYASIDLPKGYCSFSSSALRKVIPFLRQGLEPARALKVAMPASFNEKHRNTNFDLATFPKLNNNELRNPVVQQAVAETLRTVKTITKKHGIPDTIRVELLRALKQPKAKREKIRKQQQERNDLRDTYETILRKQPSIDRITPDVIKKYELWLEMGCEKEDYNGFAEFARSTKKEEKEKYELWLECNRRCPYSGKMISLKKLFSQHIHVDHIFPYSKSMDDSYINKTVCWDFANEAKGDRTPFEYLGATDWERFKRDIKNFPTPKKVRFLTEHVPDGFRNSQETDSAYIALQVREKLAAFFPNVETTKGPATAHLRKIWGLNKVLSKLDSPNYKNRNDHRHHAIDALVVALSTNRINDLVATYSKFDALGRLTKDVNKKVDAPWRDFYLDVEAAINTIIVSRRINKRLFIPKPNWTRAYSSPLGSNEQREWPIALRGSLHKENPFGAINPPDNHPFAQKPGIYYVTRKKISEITDTEKIVDHVIREIIEERIEKYGSLKKAIAENPDDPIFMIPVKKKPNKEYKFKVPIKHVRVFVKDQNAIEPFQRRENRQIKPLRREAKLDYLQSGENIVFAIYENEKTGEREFETVSIIDASRRFNTEEPVVKPYLDEKRLIMTLRRDELVAFYQQSPEEIRLDDPEFIKENIYYVVKMDRGRICFRLHYLAPDKNNDKSPLYLQKTSAYLNLIKIVFDSSSEPKLVSET